MSAAAAKKAKWKAQSDALRAGIRAAAEYEAYAKDPKAGNGRLPPPPPSGGSSTPFLKSGV